MEIIRTLGRKRLASPRIPKAYGGMGADALTTGLIVEELAREGDPNLTVNLGAAEVLIKHGTDSQKRRWLPRLASGMIVAGIASTEPGAGSDAASIATTAKKSIRGFSISGEKRYIDIPNAAAFMILTARTSKAEGSRGISLFLLPMNSRGISKYRLNHMGAPWLDFGGFKLKGVRLSSEDLIGEEGRGFPALMETFDFMRVIVGLKCIGTASKALELTMDYVKRRHAFGRPIGKFEAVQFRIAEDYTQLEAARLLCYKALSMKDQGLRITKEAAMVKSWVPELTFKIVNDCLQNMGALGYSSATPIAGMLTHIRGYSIGDGTPDIMKTIVGRELLGREYVPYR